jgi:NAD(P)H-hydrate epimerase
MNLTRHQVRELDRRAIEEFGMPGAVLMENAGRGAAEFLLAQKPVEPVLVVSGKGNNGGDGFVIARHLDNHGVRVRIALLCPPEELQGDAALNFHIVAQSGLAVLANADIDALKIALTGAGFIVDAVFGTGLTGQVKSPYDEVITALNERGLPILAVDIPSGLDCDTGKPLGSAVRATYTVTFVAQKKGFADPGSRRFTGEVHVADIGVPRKLLEDYRTSP